MKEKITKWFQNGVIKTKATFLPRRTNNAYNRSPKSSREHFFSVSYQQDERSTKEIHLMY